MSAYSLTASQRNALVAWVRRATGLAAASVVWAPLADADGRPAVRPSLPYVTIQVTTPARAPGPLIREAREATDDDALTDALGVTSVVAVQNAPPGSPSDGDVYLVGTVPSGAWVGHASQIATYDSTGAAWSFASAAVGDRVYATVAEDMLRWSGTAWVAEDDAPIEVVTAHRTFTVTLNAYARAQSTTVNAASLIDRCLTVLAMDVQTDAFGSVGLGVATVLNTRDLSALVGEAFEARVAADVQMHVVARDLAPTDVIDTVSATGPSLLSRCP